MEVQLNFENLRELIAKRKKEHNYVDLVAKVCSPTLVFGDDESIASRDFRALSFNLDAKRKQATSTTLGEGDRQ